MVYRKGDISLGLEGWIWRICDGDAKVSLEERLESFSCPAAVQMGWTSRHTFRYHLA